jgi:pimeloyl-ACP methyl ester carboxylesterase
MAAISLSLCIVSPFCIHAEQDQLPSQPSLQLQHCSIPEIPEEERCGTYHVYEDRVRKQGRQIALNIVVVPARSSSPAPDPIFWLDGGPGAASSNAAAVVSLKWLGGLHQDHDLVFVDERGTGKSGALKCGDIGEDPNNLDAYFGKLYPQSLISICRNNLEEKADLRFYATALAMDDLDDVRRALGYSQIDIAALSYGTLAASVYMRKYPDHVRAAFLLGLVTPDYRLPLPFASASQNALNQLWHDCSADVKCHDAFPQIEHEFDEVLKRFGNGPLPIEVIDPVTQKKRSVRLERENYVEHLRTMLYSTVSAKFVPYVVHQAYEGNFIPFETTAIRFNQGGPHASRGLHFSIICSESVPFITQADIAEQTQHTFLGDHRAESYVEVCKDWPHAKVSRSFLDPVRSNIPILVFSGEADGVTPPWFAESALKLWPNGRQIIIPRSGHQLDTSCEFGLIEAFFRAGSAHDLDASCTQQTQRPAFVLDMPQP